MNPIDILSLRSALFMPPAQKAVANLAYSPTAQEIALAQELGGMQYQVNAKNSVRDGRIS